MDDLGLPYATGGRDQARRLPSADAAPGRHHQGLKSSGTPGG